MDWMQLLQTALHFDQHIGSAIAQHGTAVYAILFAVVFCGIGVLPLFFLPGDSLLVICGALCASGALDVAIVVPLLIVATVAGSLANYGVGLAIGHRVYTHDYRWIDKAALRRTHDFYEKNGRITFLASPFVGVVRTFAPFVGGIAQMTFSHFVPAAAAGAVLWVVTLVGVGYYFGNMPLVRDNMSTIAVVGTVVGVGALAVTAAWRYFRARRAR